MASRPRRAAHAPARFGFEEGRVEPEANHESANEQSHYSNRSHHTASTAAFALAVVLDTYKCSIIYYLRDFRINRS